MGAIFDDVNAIEWTNDQVIERTYQLHASRAQPADDPDAACHAGFVVAVVNRFTPDRAEEHRFIGQPPTMDARIIRAVARTLSNPYARGLLLDFASGHLTGRDKRDAAVEASSAYVAFVTATAARQDPTDCWMAVVDAIDRAKTLALGFGAPVDPAVEAARDYACAMRSSRDILLIRQVAVAALRDLNPKKVSPTLLADLFAVTWAKINEARTDLALLSESILPFGAMSKAPNFRESCAAVVYEAGASAAVCGPPVIATASLQQAAKIARSHAGSYLPAILRLTALVHPGTLGSLTSQASGTGSIDIRRLDPLVAKMTGAASDEVALMYLGTCSAFLPDLARIRKAVEAQGPGLMGQILGFQALNRHGASSLSEDEIRVKHAVDRALFLSAMLLRHGIYQNHALAHLFAPSFLTAFLIEAQVISESQRGLLSTALEHWGRGDFASANFMLLPLTENACVQSCAFLGSNPLAFGRSESATRKIGESIAATMREVLGDGMADLFTVIWGQEGAPRHSYCHGFVDDEEVNSVTSDLVIYCLVSLAYQVITKLVHDQQVRVQAYHLWEQRGCTHGDDQRDWYEAEAMLATMP